MVMISQKIELSPNLAMKSYLEESFHYSRFCFNRALNLWKEQYETGNKPNGRSVRDICKKSKQEWENSFTPLILDTACEDLERAFQGLFKKRTRYPKFKSRHKAKKSFRIYRKNDSSIRVQGSFLLLLKFPKPIKMKELLKLEGVIKLCTISERAGKYFASFTVDIGEGKLKDLSSNVSCGIDLGIKSFAILAGDLEDEIAFHKEAGIMPIIKPFYKKISYFQRRLSKKKDKSSKKYQLLKAKIARLHLKISYIQNDFLQKFTTSVVKEFGVITIEDLSVRNMIKNRKLSKVISRSLFYGFRRILEYKSKLYGNILIVASKFFPSTQTCSHYGHVKVKEEKLKLSERTYTCSHCGTISDRDENAAYNLKLYGEQTLAGLQP